MKKIIAISLSVLFPVLLLFSGCDGSSSVQSVQAAALLSGAELSLPIRSAKAFPEQVEMYGYMTFAYDGDLRAMQQEIGQTPEVEAELVHNSLLLRRDSGQTADFYCIHPVSQGSYVFSGMAGVLVPEYFADTGAEMPTAFLLPVHLISDTRILHAEPLYLLHADTAYEAFAGIDAFYQFYEAAGWYTLERTEDTIRITGYRDGITPGGASIRQNVDDSGSLTLDRPIVLTFRDGGDGWTFSVAC